MKSLSHVQLFATPWTTAHQSPPFFGFFRQEDWSGVPLPSGVSNSENSHKGNHLNMRPGITQLPVAPCAGCFIQTTEKTKIQTQSSADRISAALSPANQRGEKKLSTNLTLYKAYTNHWTNLRRAETKRKKEFNLLQGKNSTFLKPGERRSQTQEVKRK